MTSHQCGKAAAGTAVLTQGLVSCAGRLVIGRAALSHSLFALIQLSMLISGSAVMALAVLPPTNLFLTFIAATFGFFAGSVVALIAPILVDLIGIQNLPLGFGLAAAVQSPGVILCPPVIGESPPPRRPCQSGADFKLMPLSPRPPLVPTCSVRHIETLIDPHRVIRGVDFEPLEF